MPQVAGTYETYDAVGNREELADKIWMITPEETPGLSLIGRKSVESVHPEWQTDELGAVDVDNNQPEGNDWSYDDITPTVRVGNYCQISEKTLIVSNTQEKVKKAGRKSEIAREVAKKGTELKIDMEAIVFSNQGSSAGSGDAASNRKLGGFRAWCTTNDSIGSGSGASGSFANGLVVAATNGNQRAFTKAIMDEVILAAYNAGGSPNTILMSPYVKTVFSKMLDDGDVVPLRKAQGKGQATMVAAADAYLSDFGLFTVIPNRQFARAGAATARNVYFIDPKMAAVGILRDIAVRKPAVTGDAEKRVLNVEYTLVMNNEAAHGVAADIYGMGASS